MMRKAGVNDPATDPGLLTTKPPIRPPGQGRSSPRRLWICGRAYSCPECEGSWGLNGVFETRELAVQACTTWRDFVAPMTLNERAPEEIVEFPHVEWPLVNIEHATIG